MSGRRVVFVVPDYVPYTGGTVSQTRVQAAELVRRGWRVDVLTRRNFPSWPRREHIDGVDVARIGPPSFDPPRHLAGVLGAWASLLGRSYRDVDVVQVVMDSDSAVAALLAGYGRRVVLMWGTLGDPRIVLQGRFGPLRRAGLQRCRHVVLTEEMRQEVEGCGLPVDAVIPVPVDTGRFRPVPPDARAEGRRALGIPEGTVIVFTGHLEVRKGVDRLLEAFARIAASEPTAHLVIVGTGEGRIDSIEDRLRRSTREHGLGERVSFAGEVQDVAPYLQCADIFCLPSFREGMPNSILEAMACGLACVAPASAGSAELLGGGRGVIPPSNDPDDLQAALSALLADPARRAELGAAARRAAETTYSVGSVVDAYEREWIAPPQVARGC